MGITSFETKFIDKIAVGDDEYTFYSISIGNSTNFICIDANNGEIKFTMESSKEYPTSHNTLIKAIFQLRINELKKEIQNKFRVKNHTGMNILTNELRMVTKQFEEFNKNIA